MYKREVIHSMKRRCYEWDYCSPSIYMVTFALSNRSVPLLGNLIIEPSMQIPPSPYDVNGRMSYSKLGNGIFDLWRDFSRLVPEINPIMMQLMPEHLHCILQVTMQMSKPLGQAIAKFKGECSKLYWKLMPEMQGTPLFEQGYQDTILFHNGQLNNMIKYVLDNPRRLAVKTLFPDLFKVQRELVLEGTSYTAVGNHYLLGYPMLRQVQVSRRDYGTEAFYLKKQELLRNIQYGTALVTPCLSEGERDIAYAALSNKIPLIVLKHNGFSRYYKPSGVFFDACADGRLLMLAPSAWGYTPGRAKITRVQACILNALAQRICGPNACDIIYNGIVPDISTIMPT
ncbi:MAG: transposase [Victivallales bacterium]|nr:transposase [Victivallales bacterium]